MHFLKKSQKKYFFRNTCHNCCNEIEFPLWGMFDDNEFYLTTIDGKDFFIGEVAKNKSFLFIDTYLKDRFELSKRRDYTIKLLRLVADKFGNKLFSKNYPVCPICKQVQNSYNNDERTTVVNLHYATWIDFENLNEDDKFKKLEDVMNDFDSWI